MIWLPLQVQERAAAVVDWASYCRVRHLPPSSIAPMLMDAPLTIFWALRRLLVQLGRGQHREKQDQQQQGEVPPAAAGLRLPLPFGQPPEEQAQQREQQASDPPLSPPPPQQQQQSAGHAPARLAVHLLGPQREVDQWPQLLELGCLLPQLELALHLVGPDVPAWADGHSLRVGSPTAAPCCDRPGCSCGQPDGATGGGGGCSSSSSSRGGIGGSTRDSQPAAAPPEQAGSITLHFHRGPYHELAARICGRHGPPDLVVGLNAGLAAYLSWVPTVQQLAASMAGSPPGGPVRAEGAAAGSRYAAAVGSGGSTTPADPSCPTAAHRAPGRPLLCLFTDYNEEAVVRTREMVAGVVGPSLLAQLQLSGAEVNPFRKPWRARPADNRLPTFSNAFGIYLTRLG